jgi:amino acid transporter
MIMATTITITAITTNMTIMTVIMATTIIMTTTTITAITTIMTIMTVTMGAMIMTTAADKALRSDAERRSKAWRRAGVATGKGCRCCSSNIFGVPAKRGEPKPEGQRP